jgi:hypothetical protein
VQILIGSARPYQPGPSLFGGIYGIGNISNEVVG